MKKCLTLLSVFLFCVNLCGCASTSGEKTSDVNATVAEITTAATAEAPTVATTITTSSPDVSLDKIATVGDISFLVSSSWEEDEETWYAGDRSSLIFTISNDDAYSGMDDETLLVLGSSAYYETFKNTEGYGEFTELETIKIGEKYAGTFDFVIDYPDYDTEMRAYLIAYNESVISMIVQMSVKGKASELSYCIDEIIDSIVFNEIATEAASEPETEPTTEEADNVTLGMKNALEEAKSYIRYSSFSYTGLIDQLEYEGYTYEECVYGADNCGADWYEQAVLCAESYIEYSGFSYLGLIDQLEYEGFTSDEAAHGADNCGADWYEEAAECAQSYMDYSSFSRQELLDQLLYEEFTYDEAEYGVQSVGY